MLVTAYFLVWILTEIRDYVLLVYSGYPILCEWEMLDLLIGTPITENPNPKDDPLWKGADPSLKGALILYKPYPYLSSITVRKTYE